MSNKNQPFYELMCIFVHCEYFIYTNLNPTFKSCAFSNKRGTKKYRIWKWQFLVILSTFWLGESSIWKKKFVAVQLMTKSLGSDKTLRRRRNKQELLLPMQYIESSRSFVRVDLTYFSYLGTSPAASWRAHHFPFPLRLFHTCRCCWIAKRRCNSQTSITIN